MSPEKLRQELAIAFHAGRIRKGMTVTEVARLLQVQRTTYQAYEAARAEPPLSVGIKLCRILGINVLKLFNQGLDDDQGANQQRGREPMP